MTTDKEAHLAMVSALVDDALKGSRYRFVVALVNEDNIQVAANLPDMASVPGALRDAATNFERDLELGKVKGFDEGRN